MHWDTGEVQTWIILHYTELVFGSKIIIARFCWVPYVRKRNTKSQKEIVKQLFIRRDKVGMSSKINKNWIIPTYIVTDLFVKVWIIVNMKWENESSNFRKGISSKQMTGLWKSRHSDWLWAVWSGFDFRREMGIFLFDNVFRPPLGPTQPPIQYVPGVISLGIKAAGAWSWPLSSI